MTDPQTPPQGLHDSIRAIEESIPMKMPWHRDMSLLWPRFERAEAKVAYFVEYIDYLERRIAALEAKGS